MAGLAAGDYYNLILTLTFCALSLLLPPVTAVLWDALRKMGLRPGYD